MTPESENQNCLGRCAELPLLSHYLSQVRLTNVDTGFFSAICVYESTISNRMPKFENDDIQNRNEDISDWKLPLLLANWIVVVDHQVIHFTCGSAEAQSMNIIR